MQTSFCKRAATVRERYPRSLTVAARLPVLVLIVLASTALALTWVFRVPIYQNPDEPMNLDYALAINRHHGLFVVHGASFETLPVSVHPYTDYLAARTETNRVAFRPDAKMPPDYGTAGYFDAIDRDAPPWDVPVDGPNRPFAVYPFGYYALLALWIGLVHCFNAGPVWTFFGARLLSVVLLLFSLLLVHGTLRGLRFKPWFALLMTACIGLFPMTTFVASAVQMDNLSFTLVSLCFYLAIRVREAPANQILLAGLGLALGALLITKVHFCLCVLAPIAGMWATRMRGSSADWLRAAALLFAPSVLLGGLYLWTTWGSANPYYSPEPAVDPLHHAIHGFKAALVDFYNWTTHDTFWGWFGWLDTPLVIRGQRITEAIRFVIQCFSWVILALTLLRIEQVASRLARLTWAGRPRLAVQLACSDPILNAYFLFTVMMFVLHIRLANRFGAQGRNWFPLLLPIFLTAIVYAPKALTLRGVQRAVSALTAAALLTYCLLGSYYGLRTIQKRYYLSPRELRAGTCEWAARLLFVPPNQ